MWTFFLVSLRQDYFDFKVVGCSFAVKCSECNIESIVVRRISF